MLFLFLVEKKEESAWNAVFFLIEIKYHSLCNAFQRPLFFCLRSALYLSKVIGWVNEWCVCSSRWMPHAIVIRKTFAPSPLLPVQQQTLFTNTLKIISIFFSSVRSFAHFVFQFWMLSFCSRAHRAPNSVRARFASLHFASTIHLNIFWCERVFYFLFICLLSLTCYVFLSFFLFYLLWLKRQTATHKHTHAHIYSMMV